MVLVVHYPIVSFLLLTLQVNEVNLTSIIHCPSYGWGDSFWVIR
jgi:hypothetical protein